MEKFSREIVIYNQKEILELSSLITKICSAIHKFTSEIDVAEERIVTQVMSVDQLQKEERWILQEILYKCDIVAGLIYLYWEL